MIFNFITYQFTVDCGPPPKIPHAHINSNDGGNTYTYVCNRGFILLDISNAKIQCEQATGQWTGVLGSLPQCISKHKPKITQHYEVDNVGLLAHIYFI